MSGIVASGMFLLGIKLPAKARLMVLLGGAVSAFRYGSDGKVTCCLTIEPPPWLKLRPWSLTIANMPEPPS